MSSGNLGHKINKYAHKLRNTRNLEQAQLYQAKLRQYERMRQTGGDEHDVNEVKKGVDNYINTNMEQSLNEFTAVTGVNVDKLNEAVGGLQKAIAKNGKFTHDVALMLANKIVEIVKKINALANTIETDENGKASNETIKLINENTANVNEGYKTLFSEIQHMMKDQSSVETPHSSEPQPEPEKELQPEAAAAAAAAAVPREGGGAATGEGADSRTRSRNRRRQTLS